MASITEYQGKNGLTYNITVYNGYDSNGKQIKARTTFVPDLTKSKRQQEKAIKEFVDNFERLVKKGQYWQADKITLNDFVNMWRKNYAKEHFAASTLYSYNGHLDSLILPSLGKYKMIAITPMVIQTFYNELANAATTRIEGKKGGYTKNSILKYHKILTSIFKFSVRMKLLEENPCQGVEIPKGKPVEVKPKFLTPDEAKRFLKMLDEPVATQYECYYSNWERVITKVYTSQVENEYYRIMNKLFYVLALVGGFRASELTALTWKAINFETSTITVYQAAAYGADGNYIKEPKTESSHRDVVLTEKEMTLLKEWKEKQKELIKKLGTYWIGNKDLEANFIFTSKNGKMMCHGAPTRTLKKLITNYNSVVSESEKLPVISTHKLRHTTASFLLSLNIDAKTIANRLGHKKVSVLFDFYIHALKENDIKAAEELSKMLDI